ncbi:arsenical pump-driving ATPase [Dermatophilus congolensis]|uniref:arsenical pump-driving ATPase n=1 Tax=Dermatophilus congolensis TaxID=1863 RepID=UPI001AAF24C4|nr:arsenical pump-driving ATPase [Dermatophilus congolensis]MBO3129622.1 arsenical pump-driving ATPase [Dermatophilus congolensis]MBO3131745.1 arsenical pump-driving ATPase [Dermatophilus congolensis]MBO3134098.1 arsenical pump-driving ATPase [Dermatophilus congolensis]MBO3136330.1 arsenical pump-driving ATPase [Dermatophilus congolensis]MBO3138578.1 arsenical pump-driving ATPase [Dermatophilus congolensis]
MSSIHTFDPTLSCKTFLNNPPRHFFFTGKGGVGKTSIACATAVTLTQQGKRVLLVSTDPASNVGHIFGTQIGNTITPIPAAEGLDALEINPEQAAEAYRNSIIDPVRTILPATQIATITEQLSGSCTTEIASFNEFTTLLADPTKTAGYDHIIFDTAPTGHTIRLLQLPGDWSAYLDRGKGDTSCLGPMAGLKKNQATYRAAANTLTDSESTRLVLVARPQRTALCEAARTLDELADLDIHATHLVINGILPDSDDADPLYQAIRERERVALAAMTPALATLPRDEITLKGTNMVSIDSLTSLFSSHDTLTHANAPTIELPDQPQLATLVDELTPEDHGLVMTMGKGGVGKTTIAAAIALARRGKKVLLTTTDPAAHITTTLEEELEGLEVSTINPIKATRIYRDRVMKTQGKDLDEDGRAALAEDLMSPCTEEIAVFQQFSRAVNRARNQFVVIDTAPTGHTLLLMDTTGSYHRDIVRHLDQRQRSRITTPLMRLQDPNYTRIIVVTLPQSTPVLEAQELATSLARADIHPWAWVVNNSLAAAHPTSTRLATYAHTELDHIDTVRQAATRLAVVPTQSRDPGGLPELTTLTN